MATLFQIEQRIANLQKKADDLRRKQSASVIQTIRKMMDQHGISIEDLQSGATESTGRNSAGNGKKRSEDSAAETVPKGALPPKYRDPKTGATWSGRARPPVWIKDAKDRTKFLIDASAE